MDMVYRLVGGCAVRGSELFCREPREPDWEGGEQALVDGEVGGCPIGLGERVAAQRGLSQDGFDGGLGLRQSRSGSLDLLIAS